MTGHRATLPRANLEVRPNTVCLFMERFQTLPTEVEFVQWLEDVVFKEQVEARGTVLEAFKFLNIDSFRKRFLMTFENETGMNVFLSVMNQPVGVLWPGLEYEVRVRAEAMTKISMEITLLDVAPETDMGLVRRTMEQFGEVKKCERMTLPAAYSKVVVNKVKVELVRNKETLPNVIHAFGTTHSAEDFLTWKLQYRGCPRFCYNCGLTTHEARQCPERKVTKEELEKMVSVVGEEQEVRGEEEEPRSRLKLSYAAVLKDPTFLDKQRREREDVALKAREAREEEARKFQEEEVKRTKREEERQEQIREQQERNSSRRAEALLRQQKEQSRKEQSRKEQELEQEQATGAGHSLEPEGRGTSDQTTEARKRSASTPSPRSTSDKAHQKQARVCLSSSKVGDQEESQEDAWASEVEEEAASRSRTSSISSTLGESCVKVGTTVGLQLRPQDGSV